MSSRYHFLLSLAATLLLSTLALADSAPLGVPFLRFDTSGVYTGARTYSDTFSINAGKVTPILTAAFNTPSGYSGNNRLGGLSANIVSGQGIAAQSAVGMTYAGGTHGTIAHQQGNFARSREGSPAATPEPGSLMLLSTGLIGLAGLVRRKLRG